MFSYLKEQNKTTEKEKKTQFFKNPQILLGSLPYISNIHLS